jgi:hypothetical protein
MLSCRAALLTALFIGALIGIGYPFLDVALACRVPDSEACVWGKAYFPLTLTISVVVLGGVAAGLVYAVLIWSRSRQGDDDAV